MKKSLLTVAAFAFTAALPQTSFAADKTGTRQIVVQPNPKVASNGEITPFVLKLPGGAEKPKADKPKIVKPPSGVAGNGNKTPLVVAPPAGAGPQKIVRPPNGTTVPPVDPNQDIATTEPGPTDTTTLPLIREPDGAAPSADNSARPNPLPDDFGPVADNQPADEEAIPDTPSTDTPPVAETPSSDDQATDAPATADNGPAKDDAGAGAVKVYNLLVDLGYDVTVLRHDSAGRYVFLVDAGNGNSRLLLINGADGKVLRQRTATADDYFPTRRSYTPAPDRSYERSYGRTYERSYDSGYGYGYADDNCDTGYSSYGRVSVGY